jgi:hypothetical protein
MKTHKTCPKCKKPLRRIGDFTYIQLAKCECDYTEKGAEGSEFWRGIHVTQAKEDE